MDSSTCTQRSSRRRRRRRSRLQRRTRESPYLGYGQGWTPLIFEYVQADVAVVVDVGMEDLGPECYLLATHHGHKGELDLDRVSTETTARVITLGGLKG